MCVFDRSSTSLHTRQRLGERMGGGQISGPYRHDEEGRKLNQCLRLREREIRTVESYKSESLNLLVCTVCQCACMCVVVAWGSGGWVKRIDKLYS